MRGTVEYDPCSELCANFGEGVIARTLALPRRQWLEDLTLMRSMLECLEQDVTTTDLAGGAP